jgi:acetyltransferase EpsM
VYNTVKRFAMKKVILGAGGHAKVVYDACLSTGIDVDLLVDKEGVEGFDGLEVVSEDILNPDEHILILGVGNNEIRQKLYKFYKLKGFSFATVIHSKAIVAEHSYIGEGTVVFGGCIINHSAKVHDAVIVNSGAIVEHDCVVENFSHVSPGAVLCGGVKVGENTWVGANSTIKEYVTIGRNCIIGAGAVVLSDLEDKSKGAGVPFKSF